MAEPDVDDIFKDFEYKVKGKKEIKEEPKVPVRRFVDDEEEEKPKNHLAERENLPPKQMPNYEKIGYIAVILVLVAYIGIDWMNYHNDAGIDTNKISVKAVTNATEANKTAAAKNETILEANKPAANSETAKAEEEKLSGIVTLTIDKISTSLSENDDDLGYINNVVFTIDNGKDKNLTPVVNVYAYDSELDEIWETRSRGYYLGAAIEPGEKFSGSISLSPKSFRNLNINKHIRLTLNDTDSGFIAAVNEEIEIS